MLKSKLFCKRYRYPKTTRKVGNPCKSFSDKYKKRCVKTGTHAGPKEKLKQPQFDEMKYCRNIYLD